MQNIPSEVELFFHRLKRLSLKRIKLRSFTFLNSYTVDTPTNHGMHRSVLMPRGTVWLPAFHNIDRRETTRERGKKYTACVMNGQCGT